jgi:ABC-2 type transport system permease protein
MVAILVAGMVGAVAFGVVDAPADLARIGGIVLLWFIPGYFLFATMWALAGALVSRPEDLNHAAGPVSFLQTLGLLAALVPFIGLDRGLAQVLSLLPGTSWAVMPVRMATESVPLWEIAASLGLMLAAIAVMLRVGGRIYAGGVLEHGGMMRAKTALRIARERGLS